MLFRRVNSSISPDDLRKGCALPEAARTAYDTAKSERLPLAYVAEQSGQPQFWFADSILHVVDVYGKQPDESEYVRLTREIISDLKLTDDMSALVTPDGSTPRYVDLRLTKTELKRYIEWARTVQ